MLLLGTRSHASKRANSVFANQFVLIQLSVNKCYETRRNLASLSASVGRSNVTNRSNRNKIGINIYCVLQTECLTFVKYERSKYLFLTFYG